MKSMKKMRLFYSKKLNLEMAFRTVLTYSFEDPLLFIE